jgi:outer membrane lipoprotein-sorting protein
MKIKFLTLLVALLAIVHGSHAQQVDDVVNSHINATGGKDNWDKARSIKMTGSVELGPNMSAPVTIMIKDRSKFRFEMEFQGMTMVQAFDGDSGWSVMPFMGKTEPERMSEEEVRGVKEQVDFTGELFDYKSKGSTVELLGKEEMEGSETFKLKISKKNGDVKYLYIDSEKYIVLKETSVQKFEDKEIESVSIPSDYRMINGLLFPFNMETRMDEEAAQGQSIKFEKIEVNPSLDNSLFVMPTAGKN